MLFHVQGALHNGTVEAKSHRQAVIEYIRRSYGNGKPTLRKIYEVGGKEGKIYHVGYTYRQEWYTVAELIPLRKEV